MCSGNISTLNDLDVTIHQQKRYGLCRRVLVDREVNTSRACSVALFVSELSCCKEEGESRWEERMQGMKGKGERQRLMCISTQACLIRQENNSTLWLRVSAPPHYSLIPYQ